MLFNGSSKRLKSKFCFNSTLFSTNLRVQVMTSASLNELLNFWTHGSLRYFFALLDMSFNRYQPTVKTRYQPSVKTRYQLTVKTKKCVILLFSGLFTNY